MELNNFSCRDKGTGTISVYPTLPWFLDINYDSDFKVNYWSITDDDKHNYHGTNAESLKSIMRWIITNFGLTDKYTVKRRKKVDDKWETTEGESDKKHDYIILYIDDLKKAIAALKGENMVNKSIYLIAMEYFDIREYDQFGDKESIKRWYQEFVAEGKAYLSPSQAMRKRLKKAMGKDTTAKDIYPPTIADYKYERSGIHGGVTYAQDSTGHIYDKPMLALDLTSAYIYGLLIKKHCSSERKTMPKTDWENYIGNTNYGSIGTYEIEYSFMHTYIKCFKDIKGKHLKTGHNTVTMVLDNIALNSFISLPHMVVHKITCLKLQEFELDYMPQYYRDFSKKLYLDKQSLDRDSIEYKNHKVYLNSGVYGNILVDLFKYLPKEDGESESDYRRRLKKHYYKTVLADAAKVSTIPLWGVYTLSYTKQLVFSLATQLVGWRYSDTDSIYCEDTPENRAKLEEFNSKIRAEIKQFCDKFGYSYDQLKDLGTFKIEAEIVKFRSFGTKSYAYQAKKLKKDPETGELKIVFEDKLHFAGCTYKAVPANLWSDSFKPKGGFKLVSYLTKDGEYRTRPIGEDNLKLFAK